ncbi:hypothetical protein ACQJBY_067572 [Aegilops geniculata]
MDLETTLFKHGWRGGGSILLVDLCPRAPPLRRRLLQRRHGAWKVVQERMQIVVCIDNIWKMEHVLGSWFVDGRYSFLLRCFSRGRVLDLEFDGVSGVLPQSDSFNGKGFTIGEPPWRSAKLHISDGAASSSGEKVIRHSFLRWLLWWCRRQVMGVGVKAGRTRDCWQ